MLKKNDVITVHIDDLTVDGAGIGHVDGMAVFVPHALPGESVTTKVIKMAKRYAVCRLVSLDSESPHRTQPFCDVFRHCGGCTLQHLTYNAQLKYKQRHIRECFARIGGIDINIPDILPSANRRAYRNKASFPVAKKDGQAYAGFYAPHSHNIVPADCPIQQPAVNAVKNAVLSWANSSGISAYDEASHTGLLRHIVVRQTSDGQIMAGIVLQRDTDTTALTDTLRDIDGLSSIVVNINDQRTNAIFGRRSRVIYGNAYITERYGGLNFRAGLTSFLQVNHAQSARLYELALNYADITAQDTVFDLYCGIGTISLLAAQRAGHVVGIEYVDEAVQNAEENARLNDITNTSFLAGDAATVFADAIDIHGAPDIVILDPPRKGADATLLSRIIQAAPKRIIYVSCNPATLARDAELLTSGGYTLERVTGVDMFPHTTHVECVVLMSLGNH